MLVIITAWNCTTSQLTVLHMLNYNSCRQGQNLSDNDHTAEILCVFLYLSLLTAIMRFLLFSKIYSGHCIFIIFYSPDDLPSSHKSETGLASIFTSLHLN